MSVNLITTDEIVIDVKTIDLRIGGTHVTNYVLKIENSEFKNYNKSTKGRHTLTSQVALPKKYTTEKIKTLKKGDIVKFRRSEEKDSVIFEVTDKNGEIISSIPYPIK